MKIDFNEEEIKYFLELIEFYRNYAEDFEFNILKKLEEKITAAVESTILPL